MSAAVCDNLTSPFGRRRTGSPLNHHVQAAGSAHMCGFRIHSSPSLSLSVADAQKSGVAQEAVKGAVGKVSSAMSLQEAQMILGVKATAGWEDVMKVGVIESQVSTKMHDTDIASSVLSRCLASDQGLPKLPGAGQRCQ